MATATATAYLILARYNHSKRNDLLAKSTSNHEQARQAALNLFPVDRNSLPLDGVPLVDTFASEVFTKLQGQAYAQLSDAQKDVFVDGIYAKPPKVPVGWMAVVEARSFSSFVEQMSGDGTGSGLWQVYDIEIFPLDGGWSDVISSKVPFPLNRNKTSAEIYLAMTPRSWNMPI